jgi:hypothetical protein
MQPGRQVSTFWRKLPPPASGGSRFLVPPYHIAWHYIYDDHNLMSIKLLIMKHQKWLFQPKKLAVTEQSLETRHYM